MYLTILRCYQGDLYYRLGHRATDVSDWGPTFLKKGFKYSPSSYTDHLLPEIPLGSTQIVSRDKLLNGN